MESILDTTKKYIVRCNDDIAKQMVIERALELGFRWPAVWNKGADDDYQLREAKFVAIQLDGMKLTYCTDKFGTKEIQFADLYSLLITKSVEEYLKQIQNE